MSFRGLEYNAIEIICVARCILHNADAIIKLAFLIDFFLFEFWMLERLEIWSICSKTKLSVCDHGV